MIPSQSKNQVKSKNKFNYYSTPVFPPQISEKSKIMSMQISEHGKSGGIIYIETEHGSFVLKANNQVAKDYFFNQFALLLNINVPPIRTRACYEQEFKQLVYLIEQYCHDDEVLYARLRNKLDFPFYELIEYIPSVSLVHVGNRKFIKNMLSQYKLFTLGMCLAFDMIINNNDRFKLIGRGQGNINNVLIQISAGKQGMKKGTIQRSKDREDDSVELGNFVFIDHDGYMIDNQNALARANIAKYMDAATEFQLNLVQWLRHEQSSFPNEFLKFIKQIHFYTQYEFTDQNIAKICQGIIYSTKKFIDLYQGNQINTLYDSISKPTNTKNKQVNYWNQYWNNQFKKVHLNFCQLFYIKISAIYTTYPELINQIYKRVGQVVQRQKNKSRKPSFALSKKNSQSLSHNGNQQGQKQIDSLNQQNGGKERQNQDEINESKQDERKRRWREKLQIFKTQNYK